MPADKLKPGDLIGVNKESYLILDTLPAEYDSRVKAMEVDERPTETYTDIGGLDKQIEELVEAIVLPMKHAEKFKTLGIRPPKGCLMYGPPGSSVMGYSTSPFHPQQFVSTNRNWEDAFGPCLCSTDQRVLPQTRRTLTCADVHR